MALQIIFNGLITGSIYALIAIGFSLIYNVHHFFYIAHGAVVTVGAFAFFSFYKIYNWNPIFAFFAAIITTVAVGCVVELGVHKPLRKRKGSNLLFFLASTSVFILIQNILLILFGPSVMTYKLPIQESISIWGALITPTQITIISVTPCVLILFYLFITKTKIGKAIRAISDDPIATEAVGINVEKMYLVLISISALLACIAGILMSLEQDLRFDMGLHAILMAIICSIIGGIGNVPAAIVGGIVLGITENLSLWFIPSGYKQVISFGILILFLLLRPQGIFGGGIKEKVEL